MCNRIHFIMQGKGGVGKSFISSLLAQFLMSKPNANVFCADTDPTNPTFSSYEGLKAKHINIMTPEMNIDRSNFDGLTDTLLAHQGDSVVDNGASSFLPIMSFIREQQIIEFLMESGKEVYMHVPLVGGLGMDETLRGLDWVLTHQPAPVVVWENELFGPVTKNGKTFTESQFFHKHQGNIKGVVRIIQRSQDSYGKTLSTVTSNRLTIQEALKAGLFGATEQQRLVFFQRDIFGQLDNLDLLSGLENISKVLEKVEL